MSINTKNKLKKKLEELQKENASLKEKAAKYQLLIENTQDELFSVDTNGLLSYASYNAKEFGGYDPEEEIGNPISMFFADTYQYQLALEKINVLIRDKKPQEFEFIFRPKDRESFWVEVMAKPIIEHDKAVGFVGTLRNISERKNTEKKQQKLFKELQTLYELNSSANMAATLDEIYGKAMDALMDALKTDRVAILLFGEDNSMHFKAWKNLSETYRKAVDGHSPWTRDTNNPKPIYIENIAEDESLRKYKNAIIKEGIQSLGFFPLLHKGELIGKFMIYFNTQHSINEDEIKIVETIAFNIANAIERKQSETKLQESEVRFNAIFNNNPNPIHLVNENYEIILTNDTLLKMKGLKQEDIRGKKCYEIYQHKKEVCENCGVSRVFKNKTSVVSENQLTLPNGEVNYFETYAYPIFDTHNNVKYAVESTINITRRKLLKQKLEKQNKEYAALNEEYIAQNEELTVALDHVKESENRLVTFMDVIPDIVCYKDGEGRWLLANKADLELFHLNNVDYVGKTDLELAQFTHEIYKSAFEDCVESDEKAWNNKGLSQGIENIPLVSGKYKIYDVIKIPVFNPDGSRKGLAVIGRDITELQETQERLEKAKNKAQESDRLKSAFLANMSHEIRTPMNGILGFADILKDPDLTGEQQQEYIKIIEKGGVRMLNIINNIVDISKIESGLIKTDYKKVNINDQIKYTHTFFNAEAEAKGLNLLYKEGLPNNEANINTDSEKVYAILTNLVKNAIKYTHKGTIELGYHKKDNFLEFYVIDTGIGIPKERQEAIFERFIQADIENIMANQGAGLGLAISKHYVEILGGKIWVESNADHGKGETGSTFYFTIPFNTDQKKKDITQKGSAEKEANYLVKPKISGLKVLIADDDEASELLLTIEMNRFSKEILIAETGKKTVEICRNNPDIDLILMDIQMPDMNGYNATKQIRKFNNKIIIIAQTAFGLSGDDKKAYAAGCNGYISKPISKVELYNLLRKYFK